VAILPLAAATLVNANVAQLPSDTATLLAGANAAVAEEAAALSAARLQSLRKLAQQQAVLNAQKRIPNNSDWRVRLQLHRPSLLLRRVLRFAHL
jgi:hypothetical protein